MSRARPFRCDRCRVLVVRDGDYEVFVGSRLVHVEATCSDVRQRTSSAFVLRSLR